MVKRNANIAKLKGSYLFPEIERRKRAYLDNKKDSKLLSLGIGDTTLPIPSFITKEMAAFSEGLGTFEGYHGYGPPFGGEALRAALSVHHYQNIIPADDIFISDGAKPDIFRLQALFGQDSLISVQDPAYPAFVDTSVLQGRTLGFNEDKPGYEGITYLPCKPENDFFPDLDKAKGTDLLILVSPNNPTGKAFNRKELQTIVDFALKEKILIIYDAAYSSYIRSKDTPKSIYEIEGAREAAIEMNSFSKMIGFTGVRCGFTVVPKELHFEDGSSIKKDWERIISTCFNGASNIASMGALRALSPDGLRAIKKMTDYYLENAHLLKKEMISLGFEVYGGENAPFIWMRRGKKEDSWDLFNEFLTKAELIVTPGSGFGPAGNGFIRCSAFIERESLHQALSRLKRLYALT
ncbi:LL-diaminopimelate aminotransferase [Criblamydia sequanensis]|uniref:LL-diaminopimelate aminotransferase n=1 Tax=Candidatus Criblamydia sequanensis CRIB-18 TaxID=1437425 RepID=A0A090E3F5_9BACT|nr:LL-diaminopimelate aminotransferase [Criblamydia sequanensis]CDR35119.1 L,L-diaminopimelate aminotransferase [Criblamydia sequanensis CRIB-18]